jgi:two-component system, NtrC family, sensor kinase
MTSDAADSRFRLFVETMPHLAWMAARNGTLEYCNHRWCAYVGHPPPCAGHAASPFPAALLHPDDAALCTQAWNSSLRTGNAFDCECRLRRAADGVYRWHLCHAAPMRDEARRLIGWCGTCIDVDDRRRAAEAAQNLDRFLASVVDNMPDAVFVKDAAELRFVRVNKAMEQLAGFEGREVIGRNDYDFFPKDEADFFTSNDRAVLAGGTMLEIPEEPMHTPKGMRILHTKKIPILDSSERPLYLLGITRDITALKRAEEQLREKNKQLEEAARAEHEALEALKTAQARLVQSEKLASLGQLVAGVAHEINNPLAFVANNQVVLERDVAMVRKLLDLYRAAESAIAKTDKRAADEISALAERIDLPYTLGNLSDLLARSRDGLKRIQQIVQDLREFSRHEIVGGDRPEEADLNAGIRSTANIVRAQARSRGVELDLDLAPLPQCLCYPTKINQVVLNLLTNAIDACGPGGKVTVTTRAHSNGDNPAAASTATAATGIELRVTDTGCGIPPDIQSKIFDPFFTTKPQGQGTGMGLSISYGIISEHGGRISVDSSPGRGATFTVTLPTSCQF